MDDEGTDQAPASETPQETVEESASPPPMTEEASSAPSGSVALGQGKLNESDERIMGMLSHLLGAVTFFVGPLIIWMIKKDDSPFVDDQGKESLNFQITVALALVVVTIVGSIPVIGMISCIAFPAVWTVNLIFCIIGGLAANKGTAYRYPFALRLIG